MNEQTTTQPPQRTYALPPSLPPRGLRRVEAAAYIGVSPSLFDQMIFEGAMPKPVRFKGRVIWDRHAIDLAWEELVAKSNPEAAASEWDRLT